MPDATKENTTLAYQARLRALSVRLVNVREKERRKLSRDLHDFVGHELGLARINLSEILRGESFDLPDELTGRLTRVEQHLKQAITQTRSLMYEYYPQVLDDAGLLPALEWLVNQYSVRRHLQAHLDIEDTASSIRFDPTLRTQIFTFVRECMYNAYKYAEAENIVLRVIDPPEEKTCFEVEDDGLGFDVSTLDRLDWQEGGFGLFSIREMIEHLGGSFSCSTTPGKGTTITFCIPDHFQQS